MTALANFLIPTNLIGCHPIQMPLQPASSVFYSPASSLWMAQIGTDWHGQSIYFTSNDGKTFRELMETNRQTGPAHIVELEATNVGKFYFRKEAREAALSHKTDTAELLVAGAMSRLETKRAEEILIGGAFYLIDRNFLFDRMRTGDVNAILNYHRSQKFRGFHWNAPDISDEGMNSLVEKAREDMRAFLALCASACHYNRASKEALSQFESNRLLEGARYYDAPARILWERAKSGNSDALEALRILAMDSDVGIRLLTNLHAVWHIADTRNALLTIPIEGRELNPSILKIFAGAGHADARRLLMNYQTEKLTLEARRDRWIQDVINSPAIAGLGILIRYGNRMALDNLFRLYEEGNLAARAMFNMLIDEGVINRSSVIGNVNLDSLESDAAENPRAVIALFQFHQDGHPHALRILRNIKSIDHLVKMAGESYDAVCAITILYRAGDHRVSQQINIVPITKWETEYSWRGHAKMEGREARHAMSMLASLGNKAAARHKGIALPQSHGATIAMIEALAKDGDNIQILIAGHPPIDTPDSLTDRDPSLLDEDLLPPN